MTPIIAEILLLALVGSIAGIAMAAVNYQTEQIHISAWELSRAQCSGYDNTPACYHSEPRIVNGKGCHMIELGGHLRTDIAICDLTMPLGQIVQK